MISVLNLATPKAKVVSLGFRHRAEMTSFVLLGIIDEPCSSLQIDFSSSKIGGKPVRFISIYYEKVFPVGKKNGIGFFRTLFLSIFF